MNWCGWLLGPMIPRAMGSRCSEHPQTGHLLVWQGCWVPSSPMDWTQEDRLAMTRVTFHGGGGVTAEGRVRGEHGQSEFRLSTHEHQKWLQEAAFPWSPVQLKEGSSPPSHFWNSLFTK
jgi:hypothetical protein